MHCHSEIKPYHYACNADREDKGVISGVETILPVDHVHMLGEGEEDGNDVSIKLLLASP